MSALYREFTLRAPEAWKALAAFVAANARACLDRGKPLRIIVTEEERRRTLEQNARLWAAVYSQIAEKAWIDGRQFSKEVWHEWFAERHMPRVEMVMPDGEIRSRRKSTTELTVAEFAEYMHKVEAEAATELGVEFDG